jgi:hypothetical protein
MSQSTTSGRNSRAVSMPCRPSYRSPVAEVLAGTVPYLVS